MTTIIIMLETRVKKSEENKIKSLFWHILLLVCKYFAVLEISPAFKSEMRLKKKDSLGNMAVLVVECSREGYKIRKFFC